MALSDFTVATKEVKFARGSLVVRGLNTDDLAALIETHFPDLGAIIDLYIEANGSVFSFVGASRFMLTMIRKAPALAANVIALAAEDESEALDALVVKARSLSFPIQALILEAVLRLTVEDVGGPKAALALFQPILAEMIPEETRNRLVEMTRATTTA